MLLYTYILIFGIIVGVIGALELLFPTFMLSFWIWWASSKWYFFHGMILVVTGFPLTQIPSANPLATPIFILGLIIVFTGPFILIYPEKIREIYVKGLAELGPRGGHFAIKIDAIVRLLTAALCIAAFTKR